MAVLRTPSLQPGGDTDSDSVRTSDSGSDSDSGQWIDTIEVIEIPDNDDIELVLESPAVANSHASRHYPIEKLHRLFPPDSVSLQWYQIEYHPVLNIHEGDVIRLDLAELGHCVEIKQLFMNYQNETAIVMRGVRYQIAKRTCPCLDLGDNEIFMMQEIYEDSEPDAEGLYLENFTYSDLRQPLRKPRLTLTNHLLGTHNTASSPLSGDSLVCRWKYVAKYDSAATTRHPRKIAEFWPRLSDQEADPDNAVGDRLLRLQNATGRDIILTANGRKLVAWDGFCGAGYATLGAKEAGLTVTLSFDRDPTAIRSYLRNHEEVLAMLMDFAEVIRRCTKWPKPDVVILSFPCQFYSLVHTVPGKDDEANEAVMFGLGDFIAKVRPRILVIEQTFGLAAQGKFSAHLLAFIALLLNLDYNVEKSVLNFAGLGEASKRRRLIIIAAAPGEALPDFPKQQFNTDFVNTDPDLFPAVSVHDRLQLCVGDHPDHAPYLRNLPHRRQAWDPRKTKMHTLTCGKSDSLTGQHWSGTRDWTPHEACLLQGAPPQFRLEGTKTQKMKQAGNAFPCIAAEAIYRQVVASLRRTDEADRRSDEERSGPSDGASPDTAIYV